MAFFKFRLPGNSPAVAAEAHAPSAGESVEAVRRRARHRLLGAVVLVFVAVVAFPLLFDSQPRPVAVDTPILIPDRQGTSPLKPGLPVPAAQAPAKPLLPEASAPVPAQASLDPGKEEVVGPSSTTPPSVAASAAGKPAPAAHALASEPKSVPAATPDKPAPVKSDSHEKPVAKPVDDGQKARALLDGKNAATEPADKVVIQVGAYTDPDKIRDVRRKLEQAGLKTYTQTIEGKDGKRTTRVRVGPFESRAEAEKAAARVRKLDLPANLISL